MLEGMVGVKNGLEIEWLKKVQPRVKKLFYLGRWGEGVFARCAGVVGSRRMTAYGERVVELLVPGLVDEGWTIVSGFMYGVDQAAHRTAMACGGRTVAVLGWGINYELDSGQLAIANRILEGGGLVVSEWEKQKPELWTFPLRNRIVAAMCQRIYVVEAAVKSGALITVDWGRKLKKEIWAVPGPVTSAVSGGTNKLIAEGLARMWIPNESRRAEERESIRDRKHAEIYRMLQNETLSADEIVRKTRRSADDIGAQLTMMILRGEVVERGGKYYIGE